MISPKKLSDIVKSLSDTNHFKEKYVEELKRAETGINHINSILIETANNGDNSIEFDLI